MNIPMANMYEMNKGFLFQPQTVIPPIRQIRKTPETPMPDSPEVPQQISRPMTIIQYNATNLSVVHQSGPIYIVAPTDGQNQQQVVNKTNVP